MNGSSKKYYGSGLPYVETEEIKGKLIIVEGTDGVGRTTQIQELQKWLEFKGYGVYVTGLARSPLLSRVIEDAKTGHNLNPYTYNLLYLADFSDRLEHEIIPALRSGFIVICDRYMYSTIARAIMRGVDREWIRKCYGIALVPDIVLYMKIDIKNLVPRVINSQNLASRYWESKTGEGMDYWESGMDLKLGEDFYDSFVKYQQKLIEEFDRMAEEFGFVTVDANRKVDEINDIFKEKILTIL